VIVTGMMIEIEAQSALVQGQNTMNVLRTMRGTIDVVAVPFIVRTIEEVIFAIRTFVEEEVAGEAVEVVVGEEMVGEEVSALTIEADFEAAGVDVAALGGAVVTNRNVLALYYVGPLVACTRLIHSSHIPQLYMHHSINTQSRHRTFNKVTKPQHCASKQTNNTHTYTKKLVAHNTICLKYHLLAFFRGFICTFSSSSSSLSSESASSS
jgi:hypothetical protein